MAKKYKKQKVSLGKKGSFTLRKGILRDKAKAAGAMTSKGTIKVSWLREKAKGKGATARQARSALGLRAMKKGKRKK